ncbi:proteasome, putative [Trichomonas vaginalis G3]|uniref:Proteasome, putative n=1 Tax=Trichomonas vaginalis (strain ATCC PRA-98 / G3) TaxID=412133 RepID=A2E404_TRIV3|nr:26S proteasome regulatory subunit family [Trichomonas vaginalis G3]EAY12659.1 proteasome, putative [Trichomonas vaginalis G3]KAI5547022.1 26S proteasome regulatory subunit family [Trichomonas vaginalis G3]|eukprot:XP_001324882.1 proteasome [Trichomonas vaginalis G3]
MSEQQQEKPVEGDGKKEQENNEKKEEENNAPNEEEKKEGKEEESVNPKKKLTEEERKKHALKNNQFQKAQRGAKNTHIPTVTPNAKCQLRLLKLERVKDWLKMEEEFINNCETLSSREQQQEDKRRKLEEVRGSPMMVGTLEEIVDDDHAIVSRSVQDFYVTISSFVDRKALQIGCSVLLHEKALTIVGLLDDDANPLVDVMKVENAPLESFADIGGLEDQIVDIKEAVELPLTHPEQFDEIGVQPPKGVILFGPPGTGKTLLARAVAKSTSATFLRVVGSELIQKYLGEGPKLVRELFKTAHELAPSIVFIDEIDAVGTKRYDSTSSGEREVQRTMLELLNQLDGFDDRGDIKVIMATNRIETLDPALIRPGRIDRKIELPFPDNKTKLKIFQIHTANMHLAPDVNLMEFANTKDEISGADIKAICSEAGLIALRDGRLMECQADFRKGREMVMYRRKENIPEGLYI